MCPFCQNYRISRDRLGKAVDRETLAGAMLELALKGCHNIELVTPTPQLPAVLESLLAACEWGLNLPLVYNCGGYEKTDVIGLLEGVVDVWLPDFKYGLDEAARDLSGALSERLVDDPNPNVRAAAAKALAVRPVWWNPSGRRTT